MHRYYKTNTKGETSTLSNITNQLKPKEVQSIKGYITI